MVSDFKSKSSYFIKITFNLLLRGKLEFRWKNGFKKLVQHTPACKKSYFSIDLLKQITVHCLNFRKLKLKFELNWNFVIFKLNILKWKFFRVTLDISKNQYRSTGGQDNFNFGPSLLKF